MKLAGKVAIVTGAAPGIGRASAIQFAKEGVKVSVADIRADLGQETVRLIASAGGTVSCLGRQRRRHRNHPPRGRRNARCRIQLNLAAREGVARTCCVGLTAGRSSLV
jgi:NAD(P)-dependent dehydrogenase (short-subunit alcohol dehydrogenase family)